MKSANNILPRIRNRIRGLGSCDRLLLLLTGGWIILAIPGNYFRVHGRMQFWPLPLMIQYLWMLPLAAILGVVAYTVVRQERRPADYGFSFKRGGVASFVALAAIHVYLVISGKLVLSPTGSFFLLTVWSTFMEELVFRAIAIDKLIQLMDGIENRAFWAILTSSTLWSIPHITSKSPAELLGIFTGGLFFGYIYYKSRSILLTAWIHSVANTGYLGGILIAGLYCLISLADLSFWSWKKQTSPAAVCASRNIDTINLDV